MEPFRAFEPQEMTRFRSQDLEISGAFRAADHVCVYPAGSVEGQGSVSAESFEVRH